MSGRDKLLNTISRAKHNKFTPMGPRATHRWSPSFRMRAWGKGVSPMSRIKIQASNRKRPISLAKVNLPEDCE